MTAEIAILNKSAVVLAADSAGTIDLGFRTQIDNSTDKLFMLSKKDPVAIMIYQNLSFVGVPFETIIKMYRKKLSNTRFNTLKEYCDDFLKFLIFNFKGNEEDQKLDIIAKSRKQIKEIYDYNLLSLENFTSVKRFLEEGGELTDGIFEPNFFEYKIDKQIENIKNNISDSSKNFPNDLFVEIRQKHRQTIRGVISTLKQELSHESFFNETHEDKLIDLACLSLLESYSGVVISGFGKNDIFPSLVSTTLYSIYNDKLYKIENQSFNITEENNAGIIPFAQKDMVETFLNGVSKDFLKEIEEFIENKIKGYSQIMNSSFETSEGNEKTIEKLNYLKQKIEDSFSTYSKDFFDSYNELIYNGIESHIGPILLDIINLPKNEMAVLAESLIHLISLKRKFSLNQDETVGGNIDVAIISKGDGFIWANRKHYFNAELNPHYIKNYGN
ncbi:MAG: hypothetical protein FWH54_00070 [Methanobrevibacter sp.]|nr:hypothetical protein [Methanobrevibacter sp.]